MLRLDFPLMDYTGEAIGSPKVLNTKIFSLREEFIVIS